MNNVTVYIGHVDRDLGALRRNPERYLSQTLEPKLALLNEPPEGLVFGHMQTDDDAYQVVCVNHVVLDRPLDLDLTSGRHTGFHLRGPKRGDPKGVGVSPTEIDDAAAANLLAAIRAQNPGQKSLGIMADAAGEAVREVDAPRPLLERAGAGAVAPSTNRLDAVAVAGRGPIESAPTINNDLSRGRPLVPWEEYTRRDVHDILAPDAGFTPQTGTWGLQGIIEYAPQEFALFVTFGQKQGAHEFDEEVTRDGVLTWQSQPKESLQDKRIKKLIEHDEDSHSIHLFLRTNDRRPYSYLGRLKYLSHDLERQNPVHFKWQILDWEPPQGGPARIGLELTAGLMTPPPGEGKAAGLTEVAVPSGRAQRGGAGTNEFRARRGGNRAKQDAKNRTLGLAGEELVVEEERRRLTAAGRPDLAAKVQHISVILGDGAGFDVLSYNADESARHIEVKTTSGPAECDFYISASEVAFAEANAGTFLLCRVYEYDAETRSGKFYVLHGSLSDRIGLSATQYRARLK